MSRRARALPPLIRYASFTGTPQQAFLRFTAGLGDWWPLRSHSVGGRDALSVVMEARAGGRIVESVRDGREHVWGTVQRWEPPHRVSFTWHPGRDAATAQDIDVRFAVCGFATQATLTHRGFEKLGPSAGRTRRGYALGWQHVLGLYTGRRDVFMAVMGAVTAVALRFCEARRQGDQP